jgi:low affinity Fe/Cu permease
MNAVGSRAPRRAAKIRRWDAADSPVDGGFRAAIPVAITRWKAPTLDADGLQRRSKMEPLRSSRIAICDLLPQQAEDPMRATLPVSSIGGGASSGSTTFGRLAAKTSQLAGKGTTFLLATAIVVLWAITGPIFHYSDTWQLVINTGTTIVTFLMVFLIQNSQNRDSLALQVKLDELIMATKGARNSIACIEDASEEELDEAKKKLRARASKNR